MISCPRCHHLNPRSLTQCELCGADLPAQAPAAAPAAVAPPARAVSAPPPAASPPPAAASPASPGDSAIPRDSGGHDATESTGPSAGGMAALIDALDQGGSEGRARGEGPQGRAYLIEPLPVPEDLHIAPSLPANPPPSGDARAPAETASSAHVVACPRCGSGNPVGHRFCGSCGARLEAPSTARPAPAGRPSRLALVCINEDGSDGPRIDISGPESIIGRQTDERFAADPFLSPRHARFTLTGNGLEIEDLNSLNGTFVRIREPIKLDPGDCFLMGRQVLRLERFEHQINPRATASDGTRYMGSPIPGGAYKLTQLGIGGVQQNTYCLPAAGAVLGRERGDVTFPGDKFMSARHAQLTTEGENNYLTDLNSSNGTWIRIPKRTGLTDQDFIFLGQQLFRVQIG
jgi:pSer/pThr/pTyr-binding forkhead associated (FHA) protein